jgi:hypothetical protein
MLDVFFGDVGVAIVEKRLHDGGVGGAGAAAVRGDGMRSAAGGKG